MSQIENTIQKLKKINFDSQSIKTYFLEHSVKKFKEDWSVFKNVIWKDIIKYSIHSNSLQSLKLGKLFKESTNGIYDYIISGQNYGELVDGHYSKAESECGIMLLIVNELRIYCYYKIDMGGCPTCGFGMEEGNPTDITLYMAETIEDLITYCMSDYDRERII